MNPRIKELKEQAMEWVPNMADPDTKIRLLNAEKFAELIVKECADICMEMSAKCARLQVGAVIAKDCAYWIKRDFGVEE